MRAYKTPLSFILAALLVTALLLPLGCAKKKTGNEQAVPEGESVNVTAEPSSSPEPAYTVLAIRSAVSGVPYYDIGETDIRSIEKDLVGTKKTIEFAGREFKLEYKLTHTRIVGDYTVREYRVLGGDERSYIFLLPDDTVCAVRTVTFRIDISRAESTDEIRQICENTLKDHVDFSSFEYCDAYDPSDTYDRYEFNWNNKINGVALPGYVSLTIDRKGQVGFLFLWNTVPAFSKETPEELNMDAFMPSVEDKLKEIYGENLNSFKMSPEASMSAYKGHYCIIRTAEVDFKSKYDAHDHGEYQLVILLDHND